MKKEIAPGIVIDSKVRFGKSVVKGTRIPADLVIRELGAGTTMEEVAREYALTREQIQAVLRYAATRIAEEFITVIPSYAGRT